MAKFMFRRILDGKVVARTIEAGTMEEAQAKLELPQEEDVEAGQEEEEEEEEAPVLALPRETPKQRVLGNMSYLKLAMAELEEELAESRQIMADLDRDFPGARR